MIPEILLRYGCALTESHSQHLPHKHDKIPVNDGTVVICDASDLTGDAYFPAEPGGRVALQPFGENHFRAFWLGNKIPKSQIWEPISNYWTCYYNCPPTLASVSISMGGSLIDNGYGFADAASAVKAIETLGGDVEIPEELSNRSATLTWCTPRPRRLPKVRLAIARASTDPDYMPTDKARRCFLAFVNINHEERHFPIRDHEIRAFTQSDSKGGWLVWDESQHKWDQCSQYDTKLMLLASGLTHSEVEKEMGRMLGYRRTLCQRAFQAEYPSDREWNYNAPQWKYKPAETSEHPHWDMVLDHVGQELNDVLPRHPWAQQHGVTTGRHYLQLWIASMLREPYEPLPYLFLHGPENSGKSILHEAIGRLITGGICRADKALTTTNDFNGELHNAVLAVVEEVNVAQSGGERAANRMKDWVTSEHLNTRMMHRDSFLSENSLHFIQCSNDSNACLNSDTRLTVLYVSELIEEIPKRELLQRLESEAPDFMRTIVDLKIPPTDGRLRIPYVTTPSQTRILWDNDPQFGLRCRLQTLLPNKGDEMTGRATELLKIIGKDVLHHEYPDNVAPKMLSQMLNKPIRDFDVTGTKIKTIRALVNSD